MYRQWIASYMLGSLGSLILINFECLEKYDHAVLKIFNLISV